jgi:hypothetical protein
MSDQEIEQEHEMRYIIHALAPAMDKLIEKHGLHVVANAVLNMGVMMAFAYDITKEEFIQGVTDAWDGHKKAKEDHDAAND